MLKKANLPNVYTKGKKPMKKSAKKVIAKKVIAKKAVKKIVKK